MAKYFYLFETVQEDEAYERPTTPWVSYCIEDGYIDYSSGDGGVVKPPVVEPPEQPAVL